MLMLRSQITMLREFRVHNAIFAMRHLAACSVFRDDYSLDMVAFVEVATALGIWAPEWWLHHPGVTSLTVKASHRASGAWK